MYNPKATILQALKYAIFMRGVQENKANFVTDSLMLKLWKEEAKRIEEELTDD